MHHRVRLITVALAAALLLALAVTSASANRLSTTSQQVRLVWSALTFGSTGGEILIECPVTVEGSFHSSTTNKVNLALIGHLTRASVNSAGCTGGRATVLSATLPWHVKYMGFTGTLPNITTIKLLLDGAAFQSETLGLICLSRSEAANPVEASVNRNTGTGALTTLRANEAAAIPVTGAFCPERGVFRGEATITRLAETGIVTIRLI